MGSGLASSSFHRQLLLDVVEFLFVALPFHLDDSGMLSFSVGPTQSGVGDVREELMR